MKTKSAISTLILIGLLLSLFFSCKKEPVKVAPTVTISSATNITATTATSGGEITSDGGAAVTSRGVCWSTLTTPGIIDNKTTDGTGIGSFTSNITGLLENTTYYLRAYANNSAGTGYGSEVFFKTDCTHCIKFNTKLSYGTLIDIDGNVYKTIQIGTQTWMAENLKTTKYRNGNPIPNITDKGAWISLSADAYCWYNNDALSNKATNGALYNWFTVSDIRNIAPVGWHIPTYTEFFALTTYLGGREVAGGKMKETGITHWQSPNTGATNESGFTALPSGRNYGSNGITSGLGIETYFYCIGNEWACSQAYNSIGADISLATYKQNGYSIRCVKD